MAKYNSSTNSVTVQKGDTLSQIALDYKSQSGGKTYQQLAALNNIENADLIYIGQIIKLSGKASSVTSSAPPMFVTKVGLGVQASNEGALIAKWAWSRSNTDHYEIKWEFYTTDSIWEVKSETTTKYKYSIQEIPINAKKARIRIKPVSKTYKKDNKDVSYWTASWSPTSDWTYTGLEPTSTSTASKPTLAIDGKYLVITASGLKVDDKYATVKFEIAVNGKAESSHKTAKIDDTGVASYKYTVALGNKYKARCRIKDGNGVYSVWSDWSDETNTLPATPEKFSKCEPKSLSDPASIFLKWPAITNADSYEIQYAVNSSYFDTSDQVTSKTGITTTEWEVTDGIEIGRKYFFRVRAVNNVGTSGWSEVKNTVIGTRPAPPTIWSSTTTAISGEPVFLYWTHNSEDGSVQNYAEIDLIIGGVKQNIPVIDDSNKEAKTTSYTVKMVDDNGIPLYPEGVEIRWSVRTAGIAQDNNNSGSSGSTGNTGSSSGSTGTTEGEGAKDGQMWSNWAEHRVVNIYVQPTVDLSVTKEDGSSLSTQVYYVVEYDESTDSYTATHNMIEIVSGSELEGITADNGSQVFVGDSTQGDIVFYWTVYDQLLTAFPFKVTALGKPTTQKPIGYHISVVANESYETVDNVGAIKWVNSGEAVYSKYFDPPTNVSDPLEVVLSASDMTLENGIEYTVKCVAAMNTALSGESTSTFTVSWSDVVYIPNAEIAVAEDSLYTYIRPYCESYRSAYFKVDRSTNPATVTSEVLGGVYGNIVSGVKTSTGEQVYYGITDTGEECYYCFVETSTSVKNITMDVYRRNYDGSFTEISTNLDGSVNTWIVDPHPALDYARYRIIAKDKTTGAVSFYDMPGYPIGAKEVVIQWNEEWLTVDDDNDSDVTEQELWTGSMIKLPYNVDISDKNDPDVSLVEYIGREHPVSYYGTQRGTTSSWSVAIDKKDTDTLYALRRLANWAGDVYVREPSGSGYWANIRVSFSQKHCELTIPVTMEITRVEGGA